FDCCDRAGRARVAGRQESDRGNEQGAGIELVRSIGLDERAESRIERLLAHFIADLVADAAPPVERALEAERFPAFDRAIESDPRHDLGIGEMLAPAA